MTALGYLLCDKSIGFGTVGGIDHTVFDRKPVGRKLIYNGNMQVTIENDGKGSGNGSGAHHKNMGMKSLFCQGFPLTDAEAVLLVRDDQCKSLKGNLLLDYSMGANS